MINSPLLFGSAKDWTPAAEYPAAVRLPVLSRLMASYDFSSPRLCVETALAEGAELGLNKNQQNYLCNVLRLSEGNTVLVFNGRDGEWRATLAVAGRRQFKLVAEQCARAQTPPGNLHYLFAPLKHARLDYMVQKAVEMGAGVLKPVLTRRTQVARINLDRMRANVVEAAEQCGVLSLPIVQPVETLASTLADWPAGRTLVFCDEESATSDAIAALGSLKRQTASVSVLIGPEGGFQPDEREAILALPSVVRLSLGPRILRADTAAVAALTLVQAVAGDWCAA